METLFSVVCTRVAKEFEDPQTRDQMVEGLQRMFKEPLKLLPQLSDESVARRVLFVPMPRDMQEYVFKQAASEKSEISRRSKLMSLLYVMHSKNTMLFKGFLQAGGFNSITLFVNDLNPYLRAQAVELLRSAIVTQTELEIESCVLAAAVLDSKLIDEILVRIESQFDGDGPFFPESILGLLFACFSFLRDTFQVKLTFGHSLTRCMRAVVDPRDPMFLEFGTSEFPGNPTEAIKAQLPNQDKIHLKATKRPEEEHDHEVWLSQLRIIGNDLFKSGDFEAAVDVYTFAIDAIKSTAVSDELRGILFWNRSLSYQKLGNATKALENAVAGCKINTKCCEFLNKFENC